jgi:hypothetical protein
MRLFHQILFTSVLATVIFAACNKAPLDKYSKESITLTSRVLSDNETILEWPAVRSSDFIRYEIFRSLNDSFDIVKGIDKIVSTSTDRDLNSFVIDDDEIFTDSLITSANQFYKVAAVLKDRKIASNALPVSSNWLLAMPSGTLDLAYNSSDHMLLTVSSAFQQQFYSYNLSTKQISEEPIWPFENGANGQAADNKIRIGTEASGTPVIIEPSSLQSSSVSLYNPSTYEKLKSVALNSVLSIYTAEILNGIIYALYIDNAGNNRLGLFNSTNGSYISSTVLAGSAQTNLTFQVSRDGETIVVYSNNSFSGTPELYRRTNNAINYLTPLAGSSTLNNDDIYLSNDGNTIVRTGNNTVYDKQGNTKGQFTQNSGFNVKAFMLSDNQRFIYFDGTGNFSLRSCADASLIKKIKTDINPSLNFNPQAILVKDKLYIMITSFNGTNTSSTFKQIFF